ncbi:arrestin domain-containing protein 17-like [Daphnia pulicaria]|uniref:arrestin domain-containing protein 17-like n=1 Tax=Daphnia pulicaria TaxID=35523 RepID=UPI001EEAB000|nr:arrestin domain-containing protein 17-like [Daphnia pulicaria]
MEIQTSSRSGYYFPGDVVSGIVSIFNKNININGLHLEVEGRLSFSAVQDANAYKKTKSFMYLTLPLIRDSPVTQDVEDGLKFPFEFILPRDIPSSYEGKFGNIQYSIKAVIKEQDSVFKLVSTGFTVKDEVTLNSQDYVQMRQSISIPRSGIMADVWLDRTGYVPGEKIKFNAMIDNKSGKYVPGTTVQFIQYTMFNDGQLFRSVKEKKILWETKGRQISDNATQLWDKFPIIVPCVPPSRMPFVDITYVIKLTVHRTGFLNFNLVVRQNIVIASYHSPSCSDIETY